MRYGGRGGAPSLRATFVRSFVSLLAVGAVLVTSLLHGATGVDVRRHALDGAVPWKASWSERYPGCVSVLLWPREERPVAVVARRPDGSITRVTVRGPRAFAAVPEGARAVGACR